MNRCVDGHRLFTSPLEFEAFDQLLSDGRKRFEAIRICAYCLMPNHFHLVLWASEDGVLSPFMQWLTTTHTTRWHAFRNLTGRGHLYQGRFKSFPIQQDHHFLTVCRYVERNPLRAGLAKNQAESWPWSSLAGRMDPERKHLWSAPWPVERPRDWPEIVNQTEAVADLNAIRKCLAKGTEFGNGIPPAP